MEFQKRQFLRLGKRPMAFVVVAVLASLMLAWAGPAQAKRMLGTKGPDKIVGTAKADVIKALGGDDRIKGRGGRDRLSGGPGADRLNAVDGRRDRRRQWRTGQGRLQGRRGRSGQDEGLRDREDREGRRSRRSRRSRRDLRQPPGGGQARGRRPAAGCAGRRAADLQRSVLRDHDHPQRFGGWVERRRAPDLDRGGVRRPQASWRARPPSSSAAKGSRSSAPDEGVRRRRAAADRRRGYDRVGRC